jgi:hypothetical protein
VFIVDEEEEARKSYVYVKSWSWPSGKKSFSKPRGSQEGFLVFSFAVLAFGGVFQTKS